MVVAVTFGEAKWKLSGLILKLDTFDSLLTFKVITWKVNREVGHGFKRRVHDVTSISLTI